MVLEVLGANHCYFKDLFISFYVYEFVYMYGSVPSTYLASTVAIRAGFPGIGVMDGCEPPCGCWELGPGPPQGQPVLLTAEPSLQPPLLLF